MDRERAGEHHDAVGEEIRVGWRMAGLGMEVAGQAMGGALLGWLWDQWRGTAPTGLAVGAILGITIGLFSLIRGALKLNRQLDQAYPTKGRGEPLEFNAEPNAEDSWDRDPWEDDPDDRTDNNTAHRQSDGR